MALPYIQGNDYGPPPKYKPPKRYSGGEFSLPASNLDERWSWGGWLIGIGGVLWAIALILYALSRRSVDSFNELASHASQLAWSMFTYGFGCFLILLGVILIAGADRS